VCKHLSGQGFEVVEAGDGEEVLRKVAEFKPDLLVLDVMMPVMDGFEVLERLQAVPGTMNIPVVFLTAKSAESDRIQGLSLGAHDYVSKPFSLKELSLRIDRLLETKERIDRLVDYGQRDEVTGLPRRSYFELSLREMALRHGSRLGMVFIVFEGLGDVTSEAGLAGVDRAMTRAAEVLQKHCGGGDSEAFWVGPAHAAVLQGNATPDRLAVLAEVLQKELVSALCAGQERPTISVTTATGLYDSDETIDQFVERVTGMSSFDAARIAKWAGASGSNSDPTESEASQGRAEVIRFPTERRRLSED